MPKKPLASWIRLVARISVPNCARLDPLDCIGPPFLQQPILPALLRVVSGHGLEARRLSQPERRIGRPPARAAVAAATSSLRNQAAEPRDSATPPIAEHLTLAASQKLRCHAELADYPHIDVSQSSRRRSSLSLTLSTATNRAPQFAPKPVRLNGTAARQPTRPRSSRLARATDAAAAVTALSVACIARPHVPSQAAGAYLGGPSSQANEKPANGPLDRKTGDITQKLRESTIRVT